MTTVVLERITDGIFVAVMLRTTATWLNVQSSTAKQFCSASIAAGSRVAGPEPRATVVVVAAHPSEVPRRTRCLPPNGRADT